MSAPLFADPVMSVEEFYALPDPPAGGKMELLRGRVVVGMPPNGKLGTRQLTAGSALHTFVKAHNLGEAGGEAGFLLSRNPDNVRAPDAFFISNELLPAGGIPEEGWVPFIPTLVVEIVSPNDLDSEVMDKVEDYTEAGIPRIWIVRPKRRTVTVYKAGGLAQVLRSGDALSSDDAGFAVSGFVLPVSDITA
jgi:Uma2 family endonuclease